jgi:hypothetical protein
MFTHQSPYASMDNNPVLNVDPDGDVSWVVVDAINRIITLTATNYVMGNNAEKHVKENNEYVKAHPEQYTGKYGEYTITVNVKYELATEEMQKSKNPGAGNNLIDYVDMPGQSSVTQIGLEPIKNEKGVIVDWSKEYTVGNYVKMNSLAPYMSSSETADHEGVGHAMMGLSDRYTDRYINGNRRSTPNPGFEKDKMGGGININQIHWNNLGRYILNFGKKEFILNKIVDKDKNGWYKN